MSNPLWRQNFRHRPVRPVAKLLTVPSLIRFAPTASSSDSESLQALMWDEGASGTCELASGEVLVGFESEPDLVAALAVWRKSPLSRAWTVHVEVDVSDGWRPSEPSPPLKVSTGAGEVEVKIDPGRAFGHGRHASTRLALDLVSSIVKQGDSVLDVGCGSGVLAVVAAKVAALVVAIDIDDEAVAATRANATSNDVWVECSTRSLADIADAYPTGFDVVAMNVLLPVHRELAGAVCGLLAPGARLVISGFLVDQVDEVAACYGSLVQERRDRIDDWVGLLLASTRNSIDADELGKCRDVKAPNSD